MKTPSFLILTLLWTLNAERSTLFAQGTAFTYQGRLDDGATPANGNYDLRFAVYNDDNGGVPLGGWLTNFATAVSDGLFTVTLDFGNQFPGAPRWIELGVRTNGGGAFTVLAPRQRLAATPYAVMAGNVTGAIADNQLSANVARLDATQTFSGQINFTNPANTFSGDARGLTNVPVNALVRTTTNSTVIGWGANDIGQATAPAGLSNVVAVACGYAHSLALKSDGTVAGWGGNNYGEATAPAGLSNVVAVAGGYSLSLALKNDGTVVAWGNNVYRQSNVPAGLSNVVAVAGGGYHSLALKSDGTVVAWGWNSDGQTNVPAGLSNVVMVAGGSYHNLALKSDSTVVAWGFNNNGQTNVPAGLSNVVAVAGGFSHSLALKSDGTVVAWGLNSSGQTNVPAGLSNVVAVAGGFTHSLALKNDGTVVAWGRNDFGQTNVPAGLNSVVALAPSPVAIHVVVIRRQPSSPMAWLDTDNTFNGINTFNGNQTYNGSQTYNGNNTIAPPATLSFGAQTRQMLNLWSTNYGIGVQQNTTYFRSDGRFSWFRFGTHSDAENDPGAGGSVLMTLNSAGLTVSSNIVATNFNGSGANLTASLSFGARTRQMLNLWNADYGIGVQSDTAYLRSGGDFAWYRGGVHHDGLGNPGSGGTSLMYLTRNGQLGLGTTSPGFPLDAVAPQSVARFTTTNSGNGAVMILKNTTASPTYLGAINFEDNSGTPGQIGYLAGVPEMRFRVGNSDRMILSASGLTVNGTFVSASDRNVKEDFTAVNAQEILEKVAALPLQSWSYTNRPGVKHVGPMAQDFRAAFGLGEDDKHIATVDADGVALAAIQGLNQKLEESQRENASLKQRVEKLERLLKKLVAE